MIVTTTGMGTEMGNIADLLNKTESDKTPLQKQLDRLTMIIAALAGLAFILMVIMGLRNGQALDAIFIAGVALAVSAIPTGLPAVVTTMYSMGTRALADQNAIVKRLPSVETLGSVSAICSDKTGTLTLNKMTARRVHHPWPEPLSGDRRRLRHQGECNWSGHPPASPGRKARCLQHRRQFRARRRQDRPGAGHAAHGAVRRCPTGRRSTDRRPDRRRADRAGGEGRHRAWMARARCTRAWPKCPSTPTTSSWPPSTT